MDKTITRADLTEALYEKVGLSRNESADLVESIINHVSDEEHEIPPRRVLVFRASQVLKQALVEDWKGGPLEAYIEADDDDQ